MQVHAYIAFGQILDLLVAITFFQIGNSKLCSFDSLHILRDGNDEYDLYDYFNFQFFELASGDNELVLEGNGSVKISGRYLYNVGA